MTYAGLGILLLLVSFIKWLAGWILFIGFVLMLFILSLAADAVRSIKGKFSRPKNSNLDPDSEAEDPNVHDNENPFDYDKEPIEENKE